MNSLFTKSELKNYFFIISGALLLSLSVVGFFLPNNIITGGTAGLSLLIHYFSNYSVGTIMVAINLPLLIIGAKYLGKMFAIRTIITIIIVSLFIDLFAQTSVLKPFIIDTILASIFGGIIIGLGLALIIKGNSSAGGSTIIARIVASKTEIKPGQVILVIDTLIIFSALFVFNDTAKVLWSIVSIYITSKVIDVILTGRMNKKIVHLVTNKPDELKIQIREHLGPHGTIINGDGLYEDEDKKIILLVVEVSKLQFLRQLVRDNDPDGFLVITEASEMLGRGD